MKKIAILLAAALLAAAPLAAGCNGGEKADLILKVCNWEDYIDENVIADFEEEMSEKYGKSVAVEYSTFGTNENLYNDLKIADGYLYDVVCPSDYMIEKMAKEGMLEPVNLPAGGAYDKYASDYIRDIFENKITWTEDGEKKSLSDYAVCYMWGTMGLVYNPEYVKSEDMKDWLSLWKADYKNNSTIKDSVRDSYFIGIAYAKDEELRSLKSQYEEGTLSAEEYNAKLTEIFNDTSAGTIAAVEKGLSELKKNIFGFEVDSGKNDIATGKIAINFAWSGDAVFAMDEAEDKSGVLLNYAVPETGSNIWFDGWCIPKNAEQKDLARDFVDFLCRPDVAVRNMEYIGYTSGIAKGDETFSIEYYDEDSGALLETVEYEGVFDWMVQTYGLSETAGENLTEVDLSYFFGDGKKVYTDTVGRQFSAQYPDTATTARCVVMNYFSDEANEAINKMWENIKGDTFPVWAIVLIVVGVLLIVGAVLLIRFKDKIFKRKRGGKKGVKVVGKENV